MYPKTSNQSRTKQFIPLDETNSWGESHANACLEMVYLLFNRDRAFKFRVLLYNSEAINYIFWWKRPTSNVLFCECLLKTYRETLIPPSCQFYINSDVLSRSFSRCCSCTILFIPHLTPPHRVIVMVTPVSNGQNDGLVLILVTQLPGLPAHLDPRAFESLRFPGQSCWPVHLPLRRWRDKPRRRRQAQQSVILIRASSR